MRLRPLAAVTLVVAMFVPALAVGPQASADVTGACGGRAYITGVATNVLGVIDTVTQTNLTEIAFPDASEPVGMVISPDGNTGYVTLYATSEVVKIDLATNTISATWGGFGGPYYLGLSSDGSKLYVNDVDSHSILVADAETGVITSTIALGVTSDFMMIVNNAGTTAYVTADDAVVAVDLVTETVVATISITSASSAPVGIGILPDDSKVYTSNQDSDLVSVIDTVTNTVTTEIAVSGSPYWVTPSPDGSTIWISQYTADSVARIDTDTDVVDAVIATPDSTSPYLSGITADGAAFFVLGYYGGTTMIDPATNIASISPWTSPGEPWDFRTCPFAEPPTPPTSSTTTTTTVDPVAPAFTG